MFFLNKAATSAAACVLTLLMASPSISHAAVVPIHQIQGTGFLSPLNNTIASTEGIVTAVVADGYFIQTISSAYDSNPATSQGLFVSTGTAPPANIVSGAIVNVTGTVEEYRPESNPHQLTFTRLKNISLTSVVSIGNALPSAITLTDSDLNDGNSIDWMERYEGMRVRVNELKVTQPIGGLLNEVTGVATLDGVFYGVLPNITRPTREPGIGITDSFVIPVGKSIPFFDSNPENLRVDSSRLTGPATLSPDYQDVVNNLTGVLDYKEGTPTLLAFPDGSTNVTLNSRTFSLGSGTKHEDISFSTYNLDRLYDDVNDPSISEPVLNTQTFENRLYKLTNSICYHIGTPQVIAVYEVENLATLQRLADSIYSNRYACYESPRYTAHLIESNDPSGLDSGLLVLDPPVSGNKATLQLLSVEQIAGNATFQNPSASLEPLFYSASLLAKIRVSHRNGSTVDLSIVISDFMSNKDINTSTAGSNGWSSIGLYVRKKRAAQALSLAQYIENRQLADPSEKIILLGNFKAEKFNDGYVDVMGIIAGREAAEANVIEYVNSPISTPLTNLSTRSEPVTESMNAFEDQNTSVANGNMQRLEHIVLNQNAMSYFSTLWGVPRANAAFGIDLMNDTSVLVRASRYEPTVAALTNDLFRSIDLESFGIPQIGRPVEGSANQYRLSSLVTNNYDFYVTSYGENSAKNVILEINSSLAQNQWNIIYTAIGESSTCTAVSATAGGSKLTCNIPELGGTDLSGIHLIGEIPVNPTLDNTTATFDMSVTHTGGGIDYDLSNNTNSKTILFTTTTDLALETLPYASPVPAGNGASASFRLTNIGINNPSNVKFAVTSGVLPSEAGISASNFSNTWTCDAGVVQVNGKTKWTCQTASYISTQDGDFFSFGIDQGLGNGGKNYQILAEASNSRLEDSLQNNTSQASISILDDAELGATANLLSENTILLNQFAYFGFNVTNTYPSVARNAKVELIFDALPQDVSPVSANSYFYNDSFRPPVWVCGNAQLYNLTQSKVICSGALQHVQTPSGNFTSWLFQAKVVPRPVVNQQTSTINATVRFYSDSIDTNLSNNTSTATQTVNQTTDLVLGRISINGVGNPGQVAEPGSIIFSISPSYDVFNDAINAPVNIRMNFELNEVIASSKIQVFRGSTNRILMSCNISPNVPTGRTRIICPDTLVPLSDYVTVIVKTDDTMHGKTITLTATGTNDLYEINPANNTISISTLVIAQSDLCISPNDSSSDVNSCGSATVLLPGKIVAGDKEGFLLNYRNLGPSTAKNMKAKIRASIAASRLTARMNEQTFCGSATVINSNDSDITCNLGNIAAGAVNKIEFWLDTIGEVNGRNLSYQVSLTSDAEEINGINNAFTSSVPIVPIVDLSSQVQTKGDSGTYLTSHDFYIMAQASGPATTSPSQIKITTNATGARTFPQIIAAGWSCSLTGGAVTNTQYICNRNAALPSNVIDRIIVRFQPNFMQAGETITVTSEHVYLSSALAVDRNAANNIGTATRRITGRRLMEETSPVIKLPVTKPKPTVIPMNKSPATARKKALH